MTVATAGARPVEALAKWLSWDGNSLKIKYLPDGISFGSSSPSWLVELSAPMGSYMGSHGATIEEALANVDNELSKRHKSK